MFNKGKILTFIIAYVSLIKTQLPCDIVNHIDLVKNGHGISSITLNCNHECRNEDPTIGLFYFKLRDIQISNFDNTIQIATRTQSNYNIKKNHKSIIFFDTVWKECYIRHQYLESFFTEVYLRNLTDFTGYLISNTKIDTNKKYKLLVSSRGLVIVFGEFNYLETKLHQFMKEAFDIKLKTHDISKYILITRQLLLQGTIEQYSTFTFMQYSRYDNQSTIIDEQIPKEQSYPTLHKALRFVIVALFIVAAFKLLYNFMIKVQTIQDSEAITLEDIEDVEQRTDQDEGREETTL